MSTTTGATMRTRFPARETPETSAPGLPYNLILALTVVVAASVVFAVVMYVFRNTFTEAALVTASLSALFGTFGTVVGAYFGIRTSNDAHDKARGEVSRANDVAQKALAMLPPGDAKKAMGLDP